MNKSVELDRELPNTVNEYLRPLKDIGNVMKWMWENITTKESRIWIRRVIFGSFMLIAMSSVMPYITSYIFKGLVLKDKQMVIYALIAFLTSVLVKKYFERSKDKAREWIIGLHWTRMNRRIMELFYEKSPAQHVLHADRLSVNFIDKAKSKILHLQQVVLFDGLPTIFNLIIPMIGLLFLSQVAGLIVVAVVLHYVVWSIYLSSKTMKVCKPLSECFREIGNRTTESMETVTFIRSIAKDHFEIEDIDEKFSSVMNEDRKFWVWYINICKYRSTVNAIGLVLIMAWGAYQVWIGSWNIGLLYPLYSWANSVCDNIWRLGDIEFQVNWNLPVISSGIRYLSIKPEYNGENGKTIIMPNDGIRIDLRDVSYTHPCRKNDALRQPAIQKVTFSILPGEKVALIGSSGAGKSTIMNLVLRHSDPSSGEILINGTNLKDVKLRSFLCNVGYIPQEPVVFNGSIRMNLTYGLSDERQKTITDDELWETMRLLQIDFGDRLTHGLDTIVGEKGIELSGGQRQRLAIGRAVIANPRLLIVDEATSALDSVTEREVQLGLEQALSHSTSALVVAHRLNTVEKLCNKFVFLKPVSSIASDESQVAFVASSLKELYDNSFEFRALADAQGMRF